MYLAKLAEQHGFEYVWTFDSHLLWQEPYVIYSAILAETHDFVRPLVVPGASTWDIDRQAEEFIR